MNTFGVGRLSRHNNNFGAWWTGAACESWVCSMRARNDTWPTNHPLPVAQLKGNMCTCWCVSVCGCVCLVTSVTSLNGVWCTIRHLHECETKGGRFGGGRKAGCFVVTLMMNQKCLRQFALAENWGKRWKVTRTAPAGVYYKRRGSRKFSYSFLGALLRRRECVMYDNTHAT